MGAIRRGLRAVVPRTPFQIGLVLVAVTLVAGWALFNRQRILTELDSGTELTVEFDRNYRLQSYSSKAKIAGVPVGLVTDVEEADGRAIVTVKLDDDDVDKLGTEPTAQIRPATLLGGGIHIEFEPGGDPGRPEGRITTDRTDIPVELDRVLEVLGSDAQDGLQSTITQFDDTLRNGGSEAFEGLLDTAPGALEPTAPVLDALGGEHDGDLARAVRDLAAVARTLQGDGSDLPELLDAAAPVARILGAEAPAIDSALADLPRTASSARGALAELDGLLTNLEATAPAAIPVVRELGELLAATEPVLADARPVVADLRAVLDDATPLLDDLGPTVVDTTGIANDVDGPVVDRIVGPVVDTLLSPYQGSPTLLYEELGFLQAGLAGFSQGTDVNGAYLNFSPGIGTDSLGGLGLPGLTPGGYSPDDQPAEPFDVDGEAPPTGPLSPPTSGLDPAELGQDGASPSAGGGESSPALDGDPHRPDGLDPEPADTDDELAFEDAADRSASGHENTGWAFPLLALALVFAAVAGGVWVDGRRRGTRGGTAS